MSGYVIRLVLNEKGSPLAAEGWRSWRPRDKRGWEIILGALILNRLTAAAMPDFTPHRRHALRFPSFLAASECWRAQSKTRPLRDDGQPNRPLTAFNVTIEAVP